MKKPIAAAATAALAVGLGLGMGVTAPPPATAAPYCGITWGSTAKAKAIESTAQITSVRTGRHTCFDRMVVNLRYKVKGYDVRYGRVYTEGQGEYVPLTGTDLRIIVKGRTYNDAGQATYDPADWDHVANVKGYRTFRPVASRPHETRPRSRHCGTGVVSVLPRPRSPDQSDPGTCTFGQPLMDLLLCTFVHIRAQTLAVCLG